MILALGRINYTKALPDLELIIDRNEPHDMITIAAARSYVRLKRKDLTDAAPVIHLLKTGNLSILNGATDVLAFDEMKPSEEEIKIIISLLDSKNEEEIAIPGLGDPRNSLLSAMSKWKDPGSQAYLKRFSESENRNLKECANLALVGKKSRYE